MNTDVIKNFLAIFVSIILIYPTYVVGIYVSKIYMYFFSYMSYGFDFYGIKLLENFFTVYFTSLMQGGTSGFLTIFITSKIIKNANYIVVFYTLASILALFFLLSYFFNLFILGFYKSNLSENVFHIIEIIVLLGSFGGCAFIAANGINKKV